MGLFSRSKPTPRPTPKQDSVSEDPTIGDMALDTLTSVLRAMAEFAMEQEEMNIATFRLQAEAWASHLILATPPPGIPAEEAKTHGGRREWEGVRRFVREYCRSSSHRVTTLTTDLRQVIWGFIRNLSQVFSQDQEVAERMRQQLNQLENLMQSSSIEELKRDVQSAVTQLRQVLLERQELQKHQMQALGEKVRVLGHELESARRESETDPLTRIANRKAFDEYVLGSVEIFKAFQQPMGLVIIDIDQFKSVNDTYGHLSGDYVLCAVADALVKVFLRKNDFVARIGGDEFAVVLRETRLTEAQVLSERILSRVRGLLVTMQSGETINVSVSIGLAALQPGDDEKAWLARADRALYAAKNGGRDRLVTDP
jgi:diguanylate cyclase (GGDEF)-like protein